MEKNNRFKIVGLILLLLSLIFSIISIGFAISLRNQRLEFFKEEEIHREAFSVELEDGVQIKGL